MNEQQIKDALHEGGAKAVIATSKAAAANERIKSLRTAIRLIAFGSWPDKYLDDMIELGDEAISVALAGNEKDEANVICFNMAANLCDCWSDAFKRSPKHFEKGLAYADRALALRLELEKTPDKVAMAHWARGKHLLSLGRFTEAAGAFLSNVHCLRAVGSDAHSESLLAGEAYLGLARLANGEPDGRNQHDRAVSGLKELKAKNTNKSADAQAYLDQLTVTATLLRLECR